VLPENSSNKNYPACFQ